MEMLFRIDTSGDNRSVISILTHLVTMEVLFCLDTSGDNGNVISY